MFSGELTVSNCKLFCLPSVKESALKRTESAPPLEGDSFPF